MPNEGIEEREKPQEINIYPLSKPKRILLYLADFFICFIFSLSLFNIAVYPLGGLALGMESKYNEYVSSTEARDEVLYANLLLFHEEGDKELSTDLEYTCLLYTSYLVNGTDEQYEVFSHYYKDLTSNEEGYEALYNTLDANYGFFEWSDGLIALKSEFKTAFAPLFDEQDEMSDENKQRYSTFQSQIFLKGYDLMLDDVLEKDTLYDSNGVSYAEEQNKVSDYLTTTTYLTVACVYISYAVSVIIDFVLCPLLTKNRKTLGMLLLRRERVDASRLVLMKKRHVPLMAIYATFFSAWGLLFVPMGSVAFNELFAMPTLFAVSLISLGICFISLLFIIGDSYNRSLSDRLTFSVMIDQDGLDDIYRAKGYKI